MSFTVTGSNSTRRFTYHRASLLSAVDQGMSLIAAGMVDVRVVDGTGLARNPVELYRRLFGGVVDSEGASEEESVDVAIAA